MADAFTTNLPDNVRELRPGKQINSYRVAVHVPGGEWPGIYDLIATSPEAAISRTRGTCFHQFRDLDCMTNWTYEVIAWVPGPDVALLPEWVPNA